LDMRRALAMRNSLHCRLILDTVTTSGQRERRDVARSISFVARPAPMPWWDYQIFMWQNRTAEQYAALRGLGVTAGEVHLASRDGPRMLAEGQIDPLLHSDLRWYVENIATDFYSAYHRWFPDRPVNWRFQEAKKRYSEVPHDLSILRREPS